MSTTATSVGCFQSVVNFHNDTVIKLKETCSCISRVEIKDIGADADGTIMKVIKMFALIIAIIPVGFWHLICTLANKITSCCRKTPAEGENPPQTPRTAAAAVAQKFFDATADNAVAKDAVTAAADPAANQAAVVPAEVENAVPRTSELHTESAALPEGASTAERISAEADQDVTAFVDGSPAAKQAAVAPFESSSLTLAEVENGVPKASELHTESAALPEGASTAEQISVRAFVDGSDAGQIRAARVNLQRLPADADIAARRNALNGIAHLPAQDAEKDQILAHLAGLPFSPAVFVAFAGLDEQKQNDIRDALKTLDLTDGIIDDEGIVTAALANPVFDNVRDLINELPAAEKTALLNYLQM